MEERIRITGDNPPRHLWTRYPNWENALDEEGLPGQDETTLRPADNQSSIDESVTFTAGNVIFADGRSFPAMISIIARQIDFIYVYPDPEREVCWSVRFHYPTQRWIPMNDAWCLVSEKTISVPLDDAGIFPLKASTRLACKDTGKPFCVTVDIWNS